MKDEKLKEDIFAAVKKGFKKSTGDWSKFSWLWQNQRNINERNFR